MDNLACNLDASATIDDSNCTYAEEYYDCNGDCLNDNDEDAIIMSLENLQSANLQDRLAKIKKSFSRINFVGVQ